MGVPEAGGGRALPDAGVAFGAIVREITNVFRLDYRHPLFKKWREATETALGLYLGAEHPLVREFTGINYRDPAGPEAPAGSPVTPADELMYSAGLEAVKELLDRALVVRREREKLEAEKREREKQEQEKKAAAAASPPPVAVKITRGGGGMDEAAGPVAMAAQATEPPAAVKITRGGGGMDEAGGPVAMAAPATEPPAAPAAPLRIFKTGQRLEDDQPAAAGAAAVETPAESNVVIEFQGRTDGPPVAAEADTHPGVSRKGETLEKFLRGIEDPEEKRLVERLKDLLDGPKPSWDEVKAAWRDILNKGPETAKRLVPLILNR